MIYFITSKMPNYDKSIIEKTIRKISSKKHLSLDVLSKIENTHIENKYFYGLENDTQLKITRIRSYFEKIFPRIIIRFDKKDFNTFYLRFNLLTTFFLLFMIISVIMNIIYSIESKSIDKDLITLTIISFGFVILSVREYKLLIKILIREINMIENRND
ncbi:hypothetical protein SAMN05444411_1282 [Lutibacter oricola]|uniref:Uncharacterized protein n=1 Tax=Lutibacter oricola TaxID=762486 RepID=A0A1H3H9U4_9FLAO|nr:hypothetical protein [Lutibacter oricola]SDY11399.1 hypothetical protein SAMN05444411_1282 [Lutibacter oricola]